MNVIDARGTHGVLGATDGVRMEHNINFDACERFESRLYSGTSHGGRRQCVRKYSNNWQAKPRVLPLTYPAMKTTFLSGFPKYSSATFSFMIIEDCAKHRRRESTTGHGAREHC